MGHLGKAEKSSLEIQDSVDDVSHAVQNVSEKVEVLVKKVEKVDILLAKLEKEQSDRNDVQEEAKKSIPQWDAWETLVQNCRCFDGKQAQFVLIAGSVAEGSLSCFSRFCQVMWKTVIDLDSRSEENGLYKGFAASSGKKQLFEMLMPEKIRQTKRADLTIDWKRTPWLFANGRRPDIESNRPKEYAEWRSHWLSSISTFLYALVEQLDEHMPVFTIIMPFKESEARFINVLLERFDEGLSSKGFTAKHIVIKDDDDRPSGIQRENLNMELTSVCLPAKLLGLGLALHFGSVLPGSYQIPSAVKGIPVPLTEQEFLYLREYLTLLYEGCEMERINRDYPEEELERIEKEHQNSFLSGQRITMLSLSRDHDARRSLVDSLRSSIQRLLDRPTPAAAAVFTLTHHPGTGGSTIARRVLWELREDYPCAIVNETTGEKVRSADDEDKCVVETSARISAIEEMTSSAQLILLDGESGFFRKEGSARRIVDDLVRRGKKRAVILHCLRGKESSRKRPPAASIYHAHVDTKLSPADKSKFEDKYRHLLPKKGLTRTFHFPLYAFLEEFKSQLYSIVHDSLEAIEKEESKGIQVIRFVALMQKFAGRSVPPALLYDLFLCDTTDLQGWQKNSLFGIHSPTYDEIYGTLSENVRYLLVQNTREGGSTYDLQHVFVAETVLHCFLDDRAVGGGYNRLSEYIQELLALLTLKPSVRSKYLSYFEDLFLHNKDGDSRLKFSVLVHTLMKRSCYHETVGKILSEAARLFANYRFYTHAARFYIYHDDDPQYRRAEEMVDMGFKVTSGSGELKQLWDTYGLIRRSELQKAAKNESIKSIEHLEEMASRAISAYKKAFAFPASWPNPFIATVQVYLTCIDWIVKRECDGDISRLPQYLSRGPDCFRSCINESFFFIEIIETIIASHSLMDTDHTVALKEECKEKLCFLKGSGGGRGGGKSAVERLLSDPFVRAWENLLRLPSGGLKVQSLAAERECKRYKVYFLMNNPHFKLENMSEKDLLFLTKLLLEFVRPPYEDLRSVSSLFKVGSHLGSANNPVTLEHCIELSSSWARQKRDQYDTDPFPSFYLYMFYFIKILEGNIVDYGKKYSDAVKKSRELSHNHINRLKPYFYLGQDSGLSALVYKRALKLPDETEHHHGLGEFWRGASRIQLRELQGRIKVKSEQLRAREKPKVFIELIQGGGIEIYAGKMGEPGRDFQAGQLVTFVVSFHLPGPTAHGVVPVHSKPQ